MWLDTVADRRTVLCILDRPPASGDELLRRVLTEFGILNRPDAPAAVSSHELTQVLRRFLAGLRTLNAHAFIVIENAEGADDPTRAEIDRLSGLDPGVLEVLLVDASTRPRVLNRRRTAATVAAVAAIALALWFSLAARGRVRPVSMPDLRDLSAPARDPAVELTGAKTTPRDPAAGSERIGLYRVQVGAFRDSSRADAASARLRESRLSVDTQVLTTGLRQVTLGPYLLRDEAAAALAEARAAGFTEAVIVKLPTAADGSGAEDRRLIARAEALAEMHDVRGLEALRAAWVDANGGAATSPVLETIDQYLDAARRAQLAADRQQLLRESGRR
jgi:sporulation related protein